MIALSHYKYIAVILFVIATVAACKEKVYNNFPDIEKPKIQLSTPKKFDTKNSEAIVHVIGTVTDNRKLNNMEVIIATADSFHQIFRATPYVLDKAGYSFTEQFYNYTNGKVVNCIAVINAKDSTGNSSTDSTLFTLY
jgi:hypothetical protein